MFQNTTHQGQAGSSQEPYEDCLFDYLYIHV